MMVEPPSAPSQNIAGDNRRPLHDSFQSNTCDQKNSPLDNETLLRYSRHILLDQLEYAGQQKLLNARVLILGAGGLGSPAAMYLASSGIGHIVICDFDIVDISNLQRQILHSESDLAKNKADSAKQTLAKLNSQIQITSINKKLDTTALREEVSKADVILDATDNFASRFSLNQACILARKPLISGSAIGMEGQVSVFRLDQAGSPCYQCLYSNEESEPEENTCTQNGVLAPMVGIIGSILATEAIKVITKIGKDLNGRLLLLNALTMEWRSIKLSKDSRCPSCSTHY